MLGGVGNHDHFHAAGYEGFSLRLYDPETRPVADLVVLDARPGRLDPPVEGRFDDDGTRARFETDDVLDGVPIRMRFDWSEITAESARWEQSFSFDDGKTWKPNWTMLLRGGSAAAPPVTGVASVRPARRRASAPRRRSRRRRSSRRAAAPRACRSRGSRGPRA